MALGKPLVVEMEREPWVFVKGVLLGCSNGVSGGCRGCCLVWFLGVNLEWLLGSCVVVCLDVGFDVDVA